MAKKGQTVQLQTELNTDEEWEKYLQRPGLLVIDIYSDWCGPCAGMQANLKKIKVEIGGDTLQLAIAKCDGITALERFRGTSEPTWMIISGGKMINFMYGANAPKLTRLITEQLKLQKMVEEGTYTRPPGMEVTERAPEEATRWNAIQEVIAHEVAIEEAKKAEEIRLRLLKESDAILENLGNLGVIVVLPHARDKYMDVMKELMNEAGLVISISEKMKITPEHILGLSYFLDENQDLYLPEASLEHMYGADSQVMVVKASHGTADLEDPVSVRVLDVIYGSMRHPPGEEDCPYRKLIRYPSVDTIQSLPLVNPSQHTNDQPLDAENQISSNVAVTNSQDASKSKSNMPTELPYSGEEFIIGIWAPPTRRILSSCFKILFPRMAGPLIIPEPPPKPPYISVCFPMEKRMKVQEMISEWEGEIERYGIFTSYIPEDAELIAKSFKKYDRLDPSRTEGGKIVIQLARRKSECLLAFATEIPLYMSPNIEEGKRECKLFFPDDYDEPLEPESVEESENDEETITPSRLEELQSGIQTYSDNPSEVVSMIKSETEEGAEMYTEMPIEIPVEMETKNLEESIIVDEIQSEQYSAAESSVPEEPAP
ncbi:hypothetical protein WA026_017066 [Henosepilachna vigintioctopunctata]|uniref:Thioredoxin domain-containing protein 3 n=1 Tax=Henosepilachna vigintioctopunctata TaxID=420089 RepID=A0AAW1TUK3_9CUCU